MWDPERERETTNGDPPPLFSRRGPRTPTRGCARRGEKLCCRSASNADVTLRCGPPASALRLHREWSTPRRRSWSQVRCRLTSHATLCTAALANVEEKSRDMLFCGQAWGRPTFKHRTILLPLAHGVHRPWASQLFVQLLFRIGVVTARAAPFGREHPGSHHSCLRDRQLRASSIP
jgi:hypothetical protein